jgi:hypothetical protein
MPCTGCVHIAKYIVYTYRYQFLGLPKQASLGLDA